MYSLNVISKCKLFSNNSSKYNLFGLLYSFYITYSLQVTLFLLFYCIRLILLYSFYIIICFMLLHSFYFDFSLLIAEGKAKDAEI